MHTLLASGFTLAVVVAQTLASCPSTPPYTFQCSSHHSDNWIVVGLFSFYPSFVLVVLLCFTMDFRGVLRDWSRELTCWKGMESVFLLRKSLPRKTCLALEASFSCAARSKGFSVTVEEVIEDGRSNIREILRITWPQEKSRYEVSEDLTFLLGSEARLASGRISAWWNQRVGKIRLGLSPRCIQKW